MSGCAIIGDDVVMAFVGPDEQVVQVMIPLWLEGVAQPGLPTLLRQLADDERIDQVKINGDGPYHVPEDERSGFRAQVRAVLDVLAAGVGEA